MDERVENEPFFWMEDSQDPLSVPVGAKRKFRPKKMEFIGWGSRPLIEFLASIGKDTSKQISQYEVTAIINEYVNVNTLFHPQKKKKILCDDRLHSLFGRKSIARIKIYDLLETHYAANQDDSDDEFFFSSDDNEENATNGHRRHKPTSSDKKNSHQKKKGLETPKSCFAAIIPANIKLVYLKRTLVQDLLKTPETFEGKVVGSFVRVKSDPNDYFQKNSHQLLQVTGVKMASGIADAVTETLLQVPNMMKDIHICMLSEDNFSEEECEDLHDRVKSGSLKRPTVVELQEKVQLLHEDITKHWIVKELALLQNLIDRANEKGWRKELFEYLERKELLQKPSEQTRLLLEVPEVIADELEPEAAPQEESNDSPRSILRGASDISVPDLEVNQAVFNHTDVAGTDNNTEEQHGELVREKNLAATFQAEDNQVQEHANTAEAINSQGIIDAQSTMTQVIELSDDDDDDTEARLTHGREHILVVDDDDDRKAEDARGREQILVGSRGLMMWHYVDPQGDIQGPFSLESLKRWNDANYFPPDFKVWKTGENKDEAVLLSDVLLRLYSN